MFQMSFLHHRLLFYGHKMIQNHNENYWTSYLICIHYYH